ncbi:hypothetical protein AB6A23_06400 [Paenibacillus tarimensis]
MHHLKRHLVIPVFLIAVLIVGTIFYKVYAWKDNGTFKIKDLVGERSAIEDVIISGDLLDGYHRVRFKIEGGLVRTDTEVYSVPMLWSTDRYIYGAPKRMNGIDYEVRGYIDFDIIYRDSRNPKRSVTGLAHLKPEIVYTKSSQEGVTFTNPLEYGLAKIGENVYYSVPTTTDYTGMNGIYELKFDERAYQYMPEYEKHAPRLVTSYSLDRNKESGSAGIEVLGLEAVGGKLALITAEDNKLVVRGYDSSSGLMLGEAVIENFIVAGRGDNKEAEAHYESYDAYADHIGNVLTLSFRSNLSRPGQLKRTIVSVDFSRSVEAVQILKGDFRDGDEHRYFGYGIQYMSYVNGKLVVAMTLSEPEESNSIPHEIVRPKRFFIYVFQASELMYKGELVTDLNDDTIRAVNVPPTYSGFAYDPAQYRNFADVTIERKTR